MKKGNRNTTDSGSDLIAVGCKVPKALKERMKAIAQREDRIYQRLVRRAFEEFCDRRDSESRASA